MSNPVDRRRRCNCANPTVFEGESTFQSSRVVMSPDFRNGEIHRGYPNGTRCNELNILKEIDEIEQIRESTCIDRRVTLPKNILDNSNTISDNSIIKQITIKGSGNIIECKDIWSAKEWQLTNTTVKDNWLSTDTPYIYNFGPLNQLEEITVKELNNNNNGKIIWGIVTKNNINLRVKLSVKIDIVYITDYYMNNYNIDKKSIADIELIDIGSSTSAFYTNLKTQKTVQSNYNNNCNLEKVTYDISWEPTLETITSPDNDLGKLIDRLSKRSKSANNTESRRKLQEILSIVNNAINNTKLSIYIRYGIDEQKLSIMGSLINIDIINK